MQSSVLSGLGATLWSMGRHGESLQYYRRLAAANHERGDLYAEAGDLYNVALLAGRLALQGAFSVDEVTRLRQEALDTAVRSVVVHISSVMVSNRLQMISSVIGSKRVMRRLLIIPPG